MPKQLTVYRLALKVPGRLARMTPDDFASHVRAHWTDWQDKWRQLDGHSTGDEMFEVAAGQPVYLVERSGEHYLVTEGTKISFTPAA